MVQAKIIYAAAYHFGPRWGTLISVFNVQDTEDALQDINYVPEFSEEEFQVLADKIKTENVSLNQLRSSVPVMQ